MHPESTFPQEAEEAQQVVESLRSMADSWESQLGALHAAGEQRVAALRAGHDQALGEARQELQAVQEQLHKARGALHALREQHEAEVAELQDNRLQEMTSLRDQLQEAAQVATQQQDQEQGQSDALSQALATQSQLLERLAALESDLSEAQAQAGKHRAVEARLEAELHDVKELLSQEEARSSGLAHEAQAQATLHRSACGASRGLGAVLFDRQPASIDEQQDRV
jgi:chromosome segregation ATPase